MYPNFNAELARLGWTRGDLACKMNVTSSTISLKLNGKSPITLREAKELKKAINSDLPLEILFEEASKG